MATITAANAIFMLSVASVRSTPQQLQQFGVDDAFTTAAIEAAEVQTGVDGVGVAGFIPRSPVMTIRFLASSPSIAIFEDWLATQDQLQDVLYAAAVIMIPAIGRKYTCFQGTLLRAMSITNARKVLENRDFELQWLPGITPGAPAISAAPM